MANLKVKNPKKISSYVFSDRLTSVLIVISGTVFNVGLLALPYFSGLLAQTLYDMIEGSKTYKDMLTVVLVFFCVMLVVQLFRYWKRFYTRRLYNNTALLLRKYYYRGVINQKPIDLDRTDAGAVMTRAVSDINNVAEGVRRLSAEVFDTGVLFIAYLGMLFYYDARLAAISVAFVPVAYALALGLRRTIVKLTERHKMAGEALVNVTLSRIDNETMIRVHSRTDGENQVYAQKLKDYEDKAFKAGVLENAVQPIYKAIVFIGTAFIVYLGGRNVAGVGWTVWNVAAFTAFVTCFAKIADKASKGAQLFNTLERTGVSWKRILPMLSEGGQEDGIATEKSEPFSAKVDNVSIHYGNGRYIVKGLSFEIKAGEKVGVTGEVASGKSTLGKLFLNERPYEGSVKICGQELKDMDEKQICGRITYLGYDRQLFSDTVRENVALGDDTPIEPYLKAVCLDGELPDVNELVGNDGVRLSGGQQARLALARTLYHAKDFIVLDDPFAAVDKATEAEIMGNIDGFLRDKALMLITHRLYLFENFDKVIFLSKKGPIVSTHNELLQNAAYRALFEAQTGVNG